MSSEAARGRLANFLMVLWNVIVLAGLLYLLFGETGWPTKILAVLVLPVAALTGYSALRKK